MQETVSIESGPKPEPEHEVQVVESGQSDIEADDYEEMLKARIPLSNNPRKADYLSNRACGFSVRESCMLASISFGTVKKWRRDDPEFRDWESGEKLAWLQSNVSHDLLQMEFMRNLRLAFRLDKKILYKANYNLNGMTEYEFDILKVIRKRYTPQDILTIQRALVPEPDHLPPGSYKESITVTVEGREVDAENARRTAARDLLENFEASRRLEEATPELPPSNGDGPIEGEVLD